jgi:Flp pilus assembly protein TadG
MKTKTKGQALTEFALILPLLLMLLLGIIEGARIVWAYITIQNAAREAARFAVSGQPLNSDGEPWTAGDGARVAAIKQVAVDRASALGVQIQATQNITDYTEHRNDPAAFGVLVKGQQIYTDKDGTPDFPGEQGLNVLVQVYYNVEMWDPIYRGLMNAFSGRYHVHLEGAVMMQNEGVDTALGSLPPSGIAVVDLPSDTGAPPPPPTEAILRVDGELDGWSREAGSDVTVSLENGPQNTLVCVSWNGSPNGVGCEVTDSLGSKTFSFHIPLTDVGPCLITAVVEGTEIARITGTVTPSSNPAIVTGGDRWPAGSPLCIGVVSHDYGKTYDISFNTDGNKIGQVTTNSSGNAVAPGSPPVPPTCDPAKFYTLDPNLAPGNYVIKSWTTSSPITNIATKTITVIPTCIQLNQGQCNQAQTVPAGSRVTVMLRSHTAKRQYNVYVVDAGGVEHQIADHVMTDANGEAYFRWDIDPESSWPNGTYTVISRDAALSTGKSGQVTLVINTPPTPYITIAGGYTWPAGSPITIQLRNHCSSQYDVYLVNNNDASDWTTVGTNLDPDPPGSCTRWINSWTIPISKTTGSYRIESRIGPTYSSSTFVASVDLDISAVPSITIDGGSKHMPGSTITLRLAQHAGNEAYDVYIINTSLPSSDPNYSKLLQTVTTDASGAKTLQYSISPTDPGNTYVFQSRKDGETIAQATLVVMPTDLLVTNIQLPASPPFGVEFPITVTIRNNSSLDIVGRSFDVDIYVDPPHAPQVTSALPPGDRKQWVATIAASSTITLTDRIALYGSISHTLYARADTTNYIIETDENNNIISRTVAPPLGCTYQISDSFTSSPVSSTWQLIRYGDANLGGPSIASGHLELDTDGSGPFNDDDGKGGFSMLAREIKGSYDFDAVVRVLQVPLPMGSYCSYSTSYHGVAGLEVRSGRDGEDLKVEWMWYDRYDRGLMATYRDTLGGSTTQVGSYVRNSSHCWQGPVWLRIRRAGDTFIFSYATGASMPAMNSASWIDTAQEEVAMGDDILIGLMAASRRDGTDDDAQFDNFYMCIRQASPDTTFPPDYQECTETIQNGRLEDPPLPTNAAGWERNGDGSVVRNNSLPHWAVPGELYGYALFAEKVGTTYYTPWVYQEVVLPTWMNNGTQANLSLVAGVDKLGSDTISDTLLFNWRLSKTVSLSTPTLLLDGGASTQNYPSNTLDNDNFTVVPRSVFTTSLLPYAGQKVQAWFYTSCGDYTSDFWLDNLSLKLCTTQDKPTITPGTGQVHGVVTRIPPGRPPEIVPGALVWIWAEDVPMQTTFAIQDGRYSFYNLPPAAGYKVYFQYEDAGRTYWYLATLDLDPDDNITLNVTLF